MEAYKSWVRRHPGVVHNLDWILYLTVWNPNRLSGSEFNYECYHALVGLLSVWHQHIIDEVELPVKRPIYSLWLDALEQVETIIELRAMHLESLGKMSRYGPLTVVEVSKALLKMLMWSQYSGHLFLRHPSPEDLEQFEAEQGLQDISAALQRLRNKYTSLSDCTTAASTTLSDVLASPFRTVRSAVSRALGWGSSSSGDPSSAGVCTAGRGEGGCGGQPGNCDSWAELQGLPEPGFPQAPWPGAEAGQREASGQQAGSSGRGCEFGGAGAGLWRERYRQHGHRGSGAPGRPSGPCGPMGVLSINVSGEQRMGMNLVWLAELMHIWRPVIYVSMLYRHGRRSWRPWATSLAVDLLSIYFQQRGKMHIRRAAAVSQPHSTSLLSVALIRGLSSGQWSPGEQREVSDRRRKLLLYLLRSPFLDAFLRGPMDGLKSRTARIPLINLVTDYLHGLMDTFCQYYTYTSGSN